MGTGPPDDAADTLAILNAILRHHVRNHLTVIRGRAQWIGRDDPDNNDVETILRRCDEMATTVDRIEAITSSIEHTKVERLDVTAFVRDELDRLEPLYDATFTLTVGAADTNARVDELFSFVFRELLDNVVTAAGGPTPSISVIVDETGDSVSLRVTSEDIDGVPTALSTDPFATTTTKPTDDEYGLFLSQAILSRYGGRIQVVETDDGHMRIDVSVPRV